MPSIKLKAILPKQVIDPEYSKRQIIKWLIEVSDDFAREMIVYPPITPWQGRLKAKLSPYPKKGVRMGGARTLRYMRGWMKRPRMTLSNNYSAEIINYVPYAVYVGGPKFGPGVSPSRRYFQAKHMAARGWKSVSDVGPKIRAKHEARLRRVILPYRNVPSG